jgi:hypothetical protein
VLVLSLLVYVGEVYGGLVLYLAGSLFPPIYMRSLIWCDMMAAALTGLALVMEVNQVGGGVGQGRGAFCPGKGLLGGKWDGGGAVSE